MSALTSMLIRVTTARLADLAPRKLCDPEGTEQKRHLEFKIKQLLSQIETETPFADLPAAERNLVIDAKRFIQGNELLRAADQKIDDLANLIEARQEAYEKLQSANKWSVPLAIIVLVLTVVFGIPSLWR